MINFFYIAHDISKIKKNLEKNLGNTGLKNEILLDELAKKIDNHPALNLDAKECYRMHEEELFLDNKKTAKEYLSRAYFRAQSNSSMKDKDEFLKKCEIALETLEQ